jgi:hypothetical protein
MRLPGVPPTIPPRRSRPALDVEIERHLARLGEAGQDVVEEFGREYGDVGNR